MHPFTITEIQTVTNSILATCKSVCHVVRNSDYTIIVALCAQITWKLYNSLLTCLCACSYTCLYTSSFCWHVIDFASCWWNLTRHKDCCWGRCGHQFSEGLLAESAVSYLFIFSGKIPQHSYLSCQFYFLVGGGGEYKSWELRVYHKVSSHKFNHDLFVNINDRY